jgi:hypothetical protein
MALKGKNLANFMTKYSDSYIVNYFFAHSNSLTQLSIEYSSDPLKQKRLINYIINRHIEFRDALIDPFNPKNASIIENHKSYFTDPNDKANGQIRGPQYDLSDKMFFKASSEGNGIAKTNLNGAFLGIINTKNTHNVQYPAVLNSAGSCSFRQGIELCNAKIISSSTGHQVIYTDDNPASVLPHIQGHKIINNMPKSQTLNDYFRCVPIVPPATPAIPRSSVAAAGSNKFVYLQEDDKKRTLNAFLKNSDIPQNVSVGTVDYQEETDAVRLVATRAIMGFIPTQHVDPRKNADVSLILQKVQQTGKVEDAKELVNFPNIFSNRHVD